MKKNHLILIFLLVITLVSCTDLKVKRNQDINLNHIGFDYLKIEKIKFEEFKGISISTNFNKYEFSNIESIYIIGYYPDNVLEKYGGCKSFSYELKNKNNGLNEEDINSFASNVLNDRDIEEMINLMNRIKIDLYVNEKIVDTKYVEIKQ